ncbi:lipoprotein, putative [Roseobacter sp. CCS2]|nr:lipoprotein, putative [Roseobacter sp. CCS2]
MIGLAGCGGGAGLQGTARPQMDRSYALRGFRFDAQAGLRIAESESFYPAADVVWRGDPIGPRIPQIAVMFEEAATRNRAILNGSFPVDVDVTLVRFHGVTNRTRFTVGGVYNVVFDMTVRRAGTDEVIEPTRRVAGNLDAPGGERAARLDAAGQTQKVRVTDFLTSLLRAQLV